MHLDVHLVQGFRMSFSRWLSQFLAGSPSKKHPLRRPIVTLSGLRDWMLEERCLLSGGVPAPTPSGGWVALSKIMWDGAQKPLDPDGITFPSNVNVPAKTVTFTNTTDQTIYPFLRDANSGIGAGRNSGLTSGAYYDPQDYHNQEFRLYVGYTQGGQDYLGLLPHSSITIRVPLVFWNAENTYIVTDGTNLIPTQTGQLNPFTYDSNSTRGISPITNDQSADGYWVTNYTTPDSSSKAGFVMLYNATVASTPALPAPAQLAEFTVRDTFLKQLGLTSSADTQVLIDYDVSYVDNALAPITMEASADPVQIPTLWPNDYAKPPAPAFGWTGSSLSFTAMQSDIQNFTDNTKGTTAYIGQYFTNPNSPPPSPSSSPPPGWPAYYAPPPAGSAKIPGGQNIFLQSPLNGTTSSLDHTRYMLTSGGTALISIAPGGTALTTGRPTQLSLTLDPAQRNTLAAQLGLMLQTGPLNLALSSNPNATIGQVTAYQPYGTVLGFRINDGGTGYPSTPGDVKYTLSGGGVQTSATGAALVNGGKITAVKPPNYPAGGIPIYTSIPSLTIRSSSGSGANISPNIGGTLQGIQISSSGSGYPTKVTYKLTGGGASTTSGTGKATAKSGKITQLNLPKYSSGIPIYTSTPSLTITTDSGSGANASPDIGGGTATVELNSGVSLPTGTPLTYRFSRPVTDYAATDITNLWYTWAQYYINYYKNLNFTGESVNGALKLQGDAADKNQAAYIAVKNSDLAGLTTPLAVGMTVDDGPGISAAPGTNVTIVSIQPDSTDPDYTDYYLSQLQTASASGKYTFGPPQALPYSDSSGIKNITVTNGGTGYVAPLTVSIIGGNGAGATAVLNASDITNGAITSIQITNPGGNYTFAPTVTLTGGGGTGAEAKATITNGQVTGITINPGQGGSGYSLGTTVTITGDGGNGAAASAVVDPKTGAVTGIVVTNSGGGYSQKSVTVNIVANNQTGKGATAAATVGSYVSTYANLLPTDPTTMLQGGTVLQFAGSVYEALEAEASIPPAQSLRFYNAVMPPPVGLVGTTIGSDLGDLPNSNGGASVLGGQVRDLIKSVLRGVWDFTAVPESTTFWYPNPSAQPVSTLPFNPFNLDPYVWFIHDVLGMSGYGFSTDDDIANVGAFTSPYATDASRTILPNNLVISYGGTSTLPQPQQWFPGVPWGVVQTTGTVTNSGGKSYVTLTAGQVKQYYEVIPVTPGQSGGAYVVGPGIPAGTTINIRNLESNLSFLLNVPGGQTVKPSGGAVHLTFTGNLFQPLSPPSPPPLQAPPLPPLPPPPTLGSSPSPSALRSNVVLLVQDEVLLTLAQVFTIIDRALMVTDPAEEAFLNFLTNSIDANPIALTPFGSLIMYVTRYETLKHIQDALFPTGPGPD